MGERIAGRKDETVAQLRRLLTHQNIRLCVFSDLRELHQGQYALWHDFSEGDWNVDGRFRLSEDPFSADVVLAVHTGEDCVGWRSVLEARGFDGVAALWLQDNHLAHDITRTVVAEADLHLSCHAGHTGHLLNEHSIAGPILPACLRGSPSENLAWMDRHADLPRFSKVVAPFFLYGWAHRTAFLEELRRECREFVCFYTDAGRREAEFYTLDADERRLRWRAFKASILVPLNRDLSIRLFEGLFWGHVLLVPEELPAFDAVITPTQAEALGILRYPLGGSFGDLDLLARRAIRRFDEEGAEGVRRRRDFVLAGHTLAQRVGAFLGFLTDLAERRCPVSLIDDGTRHGLVAADPDRPVLVNRGLAIR